MKRILVIMAALSIVFAFSACGGKENTTSESLQNTSEKQTVNNTQSDSATVSSDTTVSNDTSSETDSIEINNNSANVSNSSDTNTKADYAFDLAERSVAVEEPIKLSSDQVLLSFDVPVDGRFKLIAFDNTEYKDWPEEEPTFYANLLNDKGEMLYEQINLSEPAANAYDVDKGTVQVVITAKNATKNMKTVALSWAYAAKEASAVTLTTDSIAAAPVNDKGEATFALKVNKTAMLSFAPAEACAWESDCTFWVTDKDGNTMVEKLFVHSNEWTSRLALLPKGEYTVAVTGGKSLVTCQVTEYESYNETQFTSKNGTGLPALFAFTAQSDNKRTATFAPTKKDKQLVICAYGSGTYYDSEQTVDITIADKKGKLLYEAEVEGDAYIDVTKFKGNCTITVETTDSCVVELKLTASEMQVGTFSYEQSLADCKEDPGVKTSGFRNARKAVIKLPEDAVQLAKNEAKRDCDSVSVAYDKTANMWCVSLWNEDALGGCIDVYMDGNGITKMTISGE